VIRIKSLPAKLGFTFLIIGFVIFGHLIVLGNDWVYLESSHEGDTFYDRKDMTYPSGHIIRVRVKVVYTKEGIEKEIRAGGNKYKNLAYSTSFIEINCKNKTGRVSTVHHYSKDGKTIGISNLTSEWMPIHSGKIVDKLYKLVCK